MGKTSKPATATAVTAGLRQLHWLNKRLTIVYGLEALLVLALVHATVPITAAFLGGQRVLFDLPVSLIVAMFLAISAFFHGLQAWQGRQEYEAGLQRGDNPYRWIDNAFSASLLAVAIGVVAGMHDIASLAMLFVLGFTTHLLGWQFERQLAAKQPVEAQRTFVMLAVTGVTAWLAVGGYVLAGIASDVGLPTGLIVLYCLMILFVAGFGWIMRQRQLQQGKWQDNLLTERAWILLSFIAKTIVALQIFAIAL